MISFIILAVSLHDQVHRHWKRICNVFLDQIKNFSKVLLSSGCELALRLRLAQVKRCGYFLSFISLGGCHRKNVRHFVVSLRVIISARGHQSCLFDPSNFCRYRECIKSCAFRALSRLKFEALFRREHQFARVRFCYGLLRLSWSRL